mmetsp:Transcript_30174/g.44583  ORF Transcript_30174/g.44583 Transcript_30174/m.44583 type:complete len:272 (-) Transcript_30174:7870-8685(-)
MSKRPPSPPYLYTPSSPVRFHLTRRAIAAIPFQGSIEITVPTGSFGFGNLTFFFFLLISFFSLSVDGKELTFSFSAAAESDCSSLLASPASTSGSAGSSAACCAKAFFSFSRSAFSASYFFLPSSSPVIDPLLESSQSRPRSTWQPSLSSGGPSPPSIRVRTAEREGVFQSTAMHSTLPTHTSQPASLSTQPSSHSQLTLFSIATASFSSAHDGNGVAASTKRLFADIVSNEERLTLAKSSICAWTYREQIGTAALSAQTLRSTVFWRRSK